MITFAEENVNAHLKDRRKIKRWIAQVADSYGYKVGNVCYIFCSDEYILDVNQKYLQHDYYTDVITFDYVEDTTLAGDIFISVDTVKSNATLFHTTYIDELHRVIIHGILHLCGLKDKSEKDATRMRQAEEEALALLITL